MNDRPTTRPIARVAVLVVLLGILAAGGVGLWYLFLRPSGPAAVGSSSPAIPSTSEQATQSSDAAASADPGVAGIDGTWTLDTSIGSFTDFSGSFVGYRVQEELAGIGGQTAVGRTPQVSGSLTIANGQLTAAEVSADLSTLVSDDDRRDGQLQRQALETGRFPTATFVLTEPISLPDGAASGEAISVTATGDLTLHGVTRSVQVPLEARLADGVIGLTGSIDITFADYDMQKPSSFLVLSVDDHGIMELQLFFSPSQE